ncbi:MAG: TfoX/Sxy family protein [Proteobacteria bacterium]|nr:TfoX/Sxy family protein [Pseudomonadota bacterium]
MSDRHRFDDLFASFGPIALCRFFGGEGICVGEAMIGMVFDDRIYFKTDAQTRAAFIAEKCKPFTFVKRKSGETVVTGWYALPERLYDDPDELAAWARTALGVVRRSPTEQKKQKKRAISSTPRKAAKRRPIRRAR